MQLEENVQLRDFNTFHISSLARYLITAASTEDLYEGIEFAKKENYSSLILGGGSNILLTNDVNCLVIRNRIMGISVVREDPHHIYVKAGAGENWHGFVQYCVQNGG